jgi:hypothetical protein
VDQQDFSLSPARRSRRSERLLLLLWVLSLPFLNPWVRGDGVGYYAFARAPMIEHNLDFTEDYRHANEGFRGPRVDEYGQPKSDFRTPTGHLENHFTVGPAILWSPFLLLAHVGVLIARAMGSSVAADGFSAPYRIAMAFATAFYGFLGLLIAFRLARQHRRLVGQLATRLHVFQSLVVPRTFLFRRGSFSLVLAPDALLTLRRAVADSRLDHRPHAQRVLSQRHGPRRSRCRSPPPIPRRFPP